MMPPFIRRYSAATALACAVLIAGEQRAFAQMGEIPKPQDLVTIEVGALRVVPGAHAVAVVSMHVRTSWHVNSNPAASPNSIPTSLSAAGDSAVSFGAPVYPPGRIVKLPIDDQPMSVWDGTIEIRLPLDVAAGASPGTRTLPGKLRFQACNDQVCLPPTTVVFKIPVEVTDASGAPAPEQGVHGSYNPAGAAAPSGMPAGPATPSGPHASATAPNGMPSGAATPSGPHASAAAPNGTPAAGTTLKTFSQPPVAGSPGPKSAVVQSPLAGVLLAGGWLAFLTLFLIGLGLNLTPCVYPMLSVTVSIFGARRATSPGQAVFSAVLYVLGMATMYSALGVIAALTGSLFGGWLSNPIVTVGIGLLLVLMSLSMFGLYQLSLPPALLSRLGGSGATSALQIFASGLMVGLIAAPCVGPPVVALLAVVAQKADPVFGFTAFFTLAMGLGAPYLVLATFSNLLHRLPRSGGWMIWVEKVFGVVLFGVGLNYILLAIVPAAASWVLPGALILAGVWLGFAERSVPKPGFRWFQRVAGLVAIAAGVALIALAPRARLAFEPLALESEVAPANGRLTVIDFSADWCQPCHELDDLTFTDGRVQRALADFRRLRVDLTRYDSPEADRWRRQYAIGGVPTLVFTLGDGREVSEARVEGFLPPDAMLERVARVRAAAGAAGSTTGNSSPR